VATAEGRAVKNRNPAILAADSRRTRRSAPQQRIDTRQLDAALFFAGAFLLCFLVRLSTLNQNFWEQELVAAASIKLGWTDLIRDRFAAGEPPLYYLLLKALGLAGAPELWLRLPSAMLDSLGCGLLAWVARRASGRVGGVALALTFAFMPVLIRFGQEARPYPLLCFFFALAIAAAMIVWRYPRQAARAFGSAKQWPQRGMLRAAIVVLAAAMAGAGWTMVIGWPAVLLLQLSVLAAPSLSRVPGFARLWLILSGSVWLLILPCILGVAPHLGHFAAIVWTPDAYTPTVRDLGFEIGGVYGWAADGDLNRLFPAGWEAAPAIALAALAVLSLIAGGKRPPIRQVAVVAIAFPVILFGADAFRSLVALRHIHPSLWCLCLLYADGAAIIAWRWAGRIALALLAVCVVLQGLDGTFAQRKASWEPFLQFFRANQLDTMRGYVTEPALALLLMQSQPEGAPKLRIEVDEDPAALALALTRAMSADAPVWVLTSRPLANVVAGLPAGVGSCAGTISYHAFIVAARSFDLLPPQIRDCASAGAPRS
jgi:hypothetical protein